MKPTGEIQRVADRILERIVAGIYPSGVRLPAELDLAREFACGRSTVREALRHLAGLGVVKSRRGSGAMVLDFRREGTPALLPFYVLAGRFDRPLPILARELLRLRGILAGEAVRLAARYGDPADIAESRRLLALAPALEHDRTAHAWNELEIFRALVFSSGIWPAVWLANVFWAPMRELDAQLAPSIGVVPADYQAHMSRLLDMIEARDEVGATRHLNDWLERVDGGLLAGFERVLGPTSQLDRSQAEDDSAAAAPGIGEAHGSPRTAVPQRTAAGDPGETAALPAALGEGSDDGSLSGDGAARTTTQEKAVMQ